MIVWSFSLIPTNANLYDFTTIEALSTNLLNLGVIITIDAYPPFCPFSSTLAKIAIVSLSIISTNSVKLYTTSVTT